MKEQFRVYIPPRWTVFFGESVKGLVVAAFRVAFACQSYCILFFWRMTWNLSIIWILNFWWAFTETHLICATMTFPGLWWSSPSRKPFPDHRRPVWCRRTHLGLHHSAVFSDRLHSWSRLGPCYHRKQPVSPSQSKHLCDQVKITHAESVYRV